jgi:hypothetical protein
MLRNEQIGTAEYKTKVNFWWVNQGRSFRIEREEDIISVPERLSEMRTYPYFWENIHEVRNEDVIFHYVKGAIRAISRVVDDKIEKIQREKGVYKHERGLKVKVEYADIKVDYQDILCHFEEFKNTLRGKDNPFNCKRAVKQGYLFRFSPEGAKVIRAVYGKPFPLEIERYFKTK